MRIEEKDGTVRFDVYVQPLASRTEVVGQHGDAVKIRVAAPPVKGEANGELLSFLAKKLRVPRSAVRIARGERGRKKVVEVSGVSADKVRGALKFAAGA